MNFLFRDESLNILSHKKNKSNEAKKNIQLHFDEKWIHKIIYKNLLILSQTKVNYLIL